MTNRVRVDHIDLRLLALLEPLREARDAAFDDFVEANRLAKQRMGEYTAANKEYQLMVENIREYSR